MKRLLSIDGGGVRGYFPLRLLCEIEKRTNKKIHEIFDFYTGVSAGGLIISLILLEKYSMEHLLTAYEQVCKKIFERRWSHKISTAFGLLGNRYSDQPLEELLNEYFENLTPNEINKDFLVLSYDTMSSKNIYFTRKDFGDLPFSKIIRSTTAAPTYFSPCTFSFNNNEYSCIDGGVITNNPSEIGYLKFSPNDNRTLILSIGTGVFDENIGKVKGLIGWSKNIFDVFSRASCNIQEDEIELLGCSPHRVNFSLKKNILLDDTSSFEEMSKLFDEWLLEHNNLLDELCLELTTSDN